MQSYNHKTKYCTTNFDGTTFVNAFLGFLVLIFFMIMSLFCLFDDSFIDLKKKFNLGKKKKLLIKKLKEI